MIVPGSWFMVRGSWFLVHGSWFLVHGFWFMVPSSEFLGCSGNNKIILNIHKRNEMQKGIDIFFLFSNDP